MAVHVWPPTFYYNFYDSFLYYFNSILSFIYTHLYTFRICLFSLKEFLKSGYSEYFKNFILCGERVIIGYANTVQYPWNF